MAKTATKPQQNKETKAPETLRGVVTKRIYFNSENGYAVLAVNADHSPNEDFSIEEDIKATGNMPSVREGDQYEFSGNFITHSKWGLQFKFSSSKLILPSGKAGVARYLSQIVAGVGIKKAARIVEALGEDALDKIQADPAILDSPKLSFLTETQREEIAADLGQNSVQAELAGMLCRPGSGIGMGTVSQIMAEYGQNAVRVVKENPYILSKELFGIGFLRADKIAHEVGIVPNSPFRVEAALDYTLREAGNEGHVFLQPNDIVRRLIGRKGLIEASGVGIGNIAAANKQLIDAGKCVREGDAIYAARLYEAERIVAAAVRRLLVGDTDTFLRLDLMLNDIESRDGITYAPEQRVAVGMALENNISIITGGPGVGKTTIVKAIVEIYDRLKFNNRIYLAAPTGRAAKRMSEATGMEAKTIHRLLRWKNGGFYHGNGYPLPGPGLLIVDEVSMMDIELAAALLAAVEEDLQVVLVGDVDQLPSVGPGSVLRDMIASDCVPVTRLKYNYRQKRQDNTRSMIAEYAHKVRDGEVPPLADCGDFEFVRVESTEQAAESAAQAAAIVERLVRAAKEDGYGQMDFQVLAPMKRNSCGVHALNEMIREIYNPAEPEKEQAELGDFRVGDKVMVIKNSYDLGVLNGDLGTVSQIEKGTVIVDFGGGAPVAFAVEWLGILTLAYASTVHKAQGSEFPLVIAPLVNQHYMMLQRNLLYTAMTRAKSRLILVADEAAVKRAVNNNKIEERYSRLAERIRGEA